MEQAQTKSQPGQPHVRKQVAGPDEIIVNEQEQEKEVNQQDETFEGNEEEKAYAEGNMNNSDTEAKPTDQQQTLEGLPGTQTDPEKGTTESTDIE